MEWIMTFQKQLGMECHHPNCLSVHDFSEGLVAQPPTDQWESGHPWLGGQWEDLNGKPWGFLPTK
jgi:hypothetical protein